jgi:hypothetical protein
MNHISRNISIEKNVQFQSAGKNFLKTSIKYFTFPKNVQLGQEWLRVVNNPDKKFFTPIQYVQDIFKTNSFKHPKR